MKKIVKVLSYFVPLLLIAVLTTSWVTEAEAGATRQGWPKASSWGSTSNKAGWWYVTSAAICEIARKKLDYSITPQASGGGVNIELVNKGQMEFSHQWGPQAADAIRGIGLYDKSPKPNLRFLFNLAPSPITPITRADANIKTLKDLKGKRMLLGFPPSPVLTKIGELYLSAAGLTRDDIMALPIETGPKGNRAIIEGTAQAWVWPYGPGTASLEDMGRSVDLYIVPPTPKELAWMVSSMPGALPYKVKAGAMPGVSKDITILGMQALIVANKDVPESLCYELMKVLFDNLGDLRGYHPQFKWMKLETAAKNPVMPYHTGAIKFYKERGLWAGELEETHQKLLKEISR